MHAADRAAAHVEALKAGRTAGAPLIELRIVSAVVLAAAILGSCLFARDMVFSFLVSIFGLQFANWPLMLASTLLPRFVLAVLYVLTLVLTIAVTRAMPKRWRYPALAVAVMIVSFFVARLIREQLWPCLAVGALFAANMAPSDLLTGLFTRSLLAPVIDAGFGIMVLVSELLLPVPFLFWLKSKRSGYPVPASGPIGTAARFVPALAVSGVAIALIAPYPTMAALEWRFAHSPGVDRFYGAGFELHGPGDIAGMVMDRANSRLLLCGNGNRTVLAVSLDDLHAPPQSTGIPSGGAQFCFADSARREFLVGNEGAGTLVVADLDHYGIKRRIGPLYFGIGEMFVSKQSSSALAVVATEDVSHNGRPHIRVADLDTGQLITESRVRPGYLYVHPKLPIAYVSSYSDGFGVVALDLPSLKVRARDPADPRLDRITLDPTRDQILVASPLRGRILAYDAATLRPRGTISTQFGVRSMEVDPTRDLLVTASLVSTGVDVIDLKTRRVLATYRLGPWLRDVAIDTPCGRAFVSSRHGVYAVQYARPTEACRPRGPTATALAAGADQSARRRIEKM